MTTRAILEEFWLALTMWKATLSLAHEALNNSTVKRLDETFPLTPFFSRPQDTPVASTDF